MTELRKTIAVLPGDGIGPEVTRAATQVLSDCAAAFNHKFTFRELPFGGDAIDRTGSPLPAGTLAGCRSSDAILLGAIGGPKWEAMPLGTRPEAGLLGLRQELGLFINLRPTKLRPALRGISPLRPERLADCDFEIIRELAGDVYFGEHKIDNQKAHDTGSYTVPEIDRVARYGFERAHARKRKLTSVDKANVLAISTLWRDTVSALAKKYPEVQLEHMYVDNAAMQIMLRPAQFDVILTSNLFGDILSDEAAALAGSIGLIPSMSRGRPEQPALYEPIHGSAPSIAGKDLACPIGAILSAAMMLRESFGLEIEAQWIETGIDRVLERGYRTADIAEPGGKSVRSSELTEQIRSELHDVLIHHERYGWGV
ncbi:MAG TPA: 3-isopropylmalate dehydrogenase [Candidatus Acidoferrales bacterium]|jgi:3-isopropylmalate dehydrogenase|nr:3-isopropylmalate dehydrogenase [Candidatus Acidoferrales bacterium]